MNHEWTRMDTNKTGTRDKTARDKGEKSLLCLVFIRVYSRPFVVKNVFGIS